MQQADVEDGLAKPLSVTLLVAAPCLAPLVLESMLSCLDHVVSCPAGATCCRSVTDGVTGWHAALGNTTTDTDTPDAMHK